MDPRGTTNSPPTEQADQTQGRTKRNTPFVWQGDRASESWERREGRSRWEDGPRLYVLPLPKFKVFVCLVSPTVQKGKKINVYFLSFLELLLALSLFKLSGHCYLQEQGRCVAIRTCPVLCHSLTLSLNQEQKRIPAAQIHSIHGHTPNRDVFDICALFLGNRLLFFFFF